MRTAHSVTYRTGTLLTSLVTLPTFCASMIAEGGAAFTRARLRFSTSSTGRAARNPRAVVSCGSVGDPLGDHFIPLDPGL